MTMRRKTITLLASALAAAAALVLSFTIVRTPAPAEEPEQITTPDVAPAPAEGEDYAAGAARAEALVTIDPATSIPDYRRDEFGTAWADLDGNGCRQRDDVLSRDLTDVVLDTDGCTVLAGTLQDPYTGTAVAFQHDRIADPGNPGSQGVQIDHIVSLAAVHRGGAWTWTPDKREQYANSLENLIAVDGPTNQAKSDRGPATWMPEPAFACTYALEYTEILTDWELSIDPADQDALVGTLTSCAESAAPANQD